MAYTTDLRTGAANRSLRDRATGLFALLAERRAKHGVYRTTVNELQSLTDRDLADLGLHRSEIRRVALEAAYGK